MRSDWGTFTVTTDKFIAKKKLLAKDYVRNYANIFLNIKYAMLFNFAFRSGKYKTVINAKTLKILFKIRNDLNFFNLNLV